MFPQFKKINNESGVVLFIVLMVAIVIMIFSVGILTQSMNENNYAQQQVDQIASDQLAKGLFWNEYSSSYSAGNIQTMQNASLNLNAQGRTYQVRVNCVAVAPAGCLTCTTCTATSNYDTFQ